MYELQPLKEVINLLERTRTHAKKSMRGSHINLRRWGRTFHHSKPRKRKAKTKGTFFSLPIQEGIKI